ncbi:cupin domain-containing protein [Candidatus Nitrosocosmicus franklandus]|uniref:Oxalate decarboxylase OxdD n=1 Tax=Candidatus Nitrosocosmicus franklandianus TaxID=1798806 RepID=A0A484ID25_9ARCH|nr:cupin domain-containing protein [Candidatus Nitrosocosmicus franklandus]VFJ14627.1 Oxalate decarboxylase OxdD [Candidatus Nitrosocosmicus franklandus]
MDKHPNSSRIFDLDEIMPQTENPLGSITRMDADNFPILRGMAGSLLRLKKKGSLQIPHWHINSVELNYCLSGKARMTMYGNGKKDAFILNPGQLTFVPKGYWHDIENIGEEELKVIMVHDDERPTQISLTESVQSLPKDILNSIFGLSQQAVFSQLENNGFFDYIVASLHTDETGGNITNAKNSESETNPYTINLRAMEPQIQTPGGIARLGSTPYFPILKGLSVFVLDLEPRGIIEPHTHPNAGELNYVIDGKVRFTILGPNNEVETGEMGKGQVFFVPAGYFHYLQNSDYSRQGIVASFFSNESPQFIGLVGAMSSYSNEVIEAVFSKESGFFKDFPHVVKNIFISAETK